MKAKYIVQFMKINRRRLGYLFIWLALLYIAQNFFLVYTFNSIKMQTPVSFAELGVGLGLFIPSAVCAAAVLVKISNNMQKRKMLIMICITVILYLLADMFFSFAAGLLAKVIYAKINGSIITAKIALDTALSILKIPILSLAVCMIGNVAAKGSFTARIGIKKYLAVCAMCTAIWLVQLLFSMITGGTVVMVVQGLTVIGLITVLLAAAFVIFEEEKENEII